MVLHILRIAAVTAVLGLCMFLPFMPGDYDSSAITLSAMVQIFSFACLLLLPIGIIWLIHVVRKKGSPNIKDNNRLYAKIALYISILPLFAGSLAASINNSLSMFVLSFLTGILFILSQFKRLRSKPASDSLPLYLILIPVILFSARLLLIEPAIEYSRKLAIRNSEALIRDIEDYKNRNGRYPASLLSLWEDYQPRVRGIKRFYYELNGDAYNIYFEQFPLQLSAKEVVMYNKLDQQEISSHNQDLLRLTPGEIALQRGYFIKKDLPEPHWKQFLFD